LLALGEAISSHRDNSYRLIAAASLGRISTPENAAGLAQQISTAPEETQTELLEILAGMGRSGAEELLQLIFAGPGEALSRRAALAACKADSRPAELPHREKPHLALVRNGTPPEENFSPSRLLAKKLSSEAAEQVVRVVKFLLAGNCPEATAVASGALRHSRPWVGVILLQTLGETAAPGAGGLLLTALDSPRLEFRLEALRSLNQLAGKLPAEIAQRALGPLVRMAQSGGLSARQLPLRLLAIKALGNLKQDTAIPALANLLAQRGWFFAKGRTQIRLAAASALGEMASPAALAALQQGSRAAYSGTAQACRAALDRLRINQNDFPQNVRGES
jgi:HEAT repeat protein